MSYLVDEFTEIVTTLSSSLPCLRTTERVHMDILDQTVRIAIASELHTYHLMAHRLQQLDTHAGFSLLKKAFSPHHLLFLVRSSPYYRHSDDLTPYDECTRNTAESICNVQFVDTGWKRARQPVGLGRLGFWSTLSLPVCTSVLVHYFVPVHYFAYFRSL